MKILFLSHQKDSAELTPKSAVPSLVPRFLPQCLSLANFAGSPGKIDHMQWCTWMLGREEWCILSVQLWDGFLNWRNVTKTDLMLSRHSVTLWSVVVIGSALSYLWFIQECAIPPHVHPMWRYVIARDSVYQAFPHVSTASDKCWGEKAWVRGYVTPKYLQLGYTYLASIWRYSCDECSKAFPVFLVLLYLCKPKIKLK